MGHVEERPKEGKTTRAGGEVRGRATLEEEVGQQEEEDKEEDRRKRDDVGEHPAGAAGLCYSGDKTENPRVTSNYRCQDKGVSQ